MLKGQKKPIDKKQGNTKHETNLERSIVYTPGGLKALHCTNFTLGPDIILNTKRIHRTIGSHNGF